LFDKEIIKAVRDYDGPAKHIVDEWLSLKLLEWYVPLPPNERSSYEMKT